MALDVRTFIDVRTIIQTGGVARRPFGRGLLLTTDDRLSAGGSGKARLFNSLASVEAVFDSGPVLDAATVWFSADPVPQGLWVGRWAFDTVNSSLTGGLPALANAFTSNDYSFRISGTDVTGIDLSGASTYTAIASAIQTALQGETGYTQATVTFTEGRFIIVTNTNPIAGGFLEAATSSDGTQVGTNLVPLVAMGEGQPEYLEGHAAETAVAALSAIRTLAGAGAPVALMLDSGVPLTLGSPPNEVDTRETLAASAEANDMVFGLLDTDAGALVAQEGTSHGYGAFSRNQGQVFSVFDNVGAKPDVGGLAFMSGIDLSKPKSLATPHAKAIPGVAPSLIDDVQYAELARKRVNVVATVGGSARLVGGFTSRPDYYLDSVWWLMWLRDEVVSAQWAAMGASRRLTTAELLDALSEVFGQGIENGGIQPGGTVNAATKADIIDVTGNSAFDGTLSAGYLIWVERPSNRSAIDRANRRANWKAWLAPTEAIHNVSGDIVLSG